MPACVCVFVVVYGTTIRCVCVFVSNKLVMCVISPSRDAECPHVFVSLWLCLALLSHDTCLRLSGNVCMPPGGDAQRLHGDHHR